MLYSNSFAIVQHVGYQHMHTRVGLTKKAIFLQMQLRTQARTNNGMQCYNKKDLTTGSIAKNST
jgi:hypothetical protein